MNSKSITHLVDLNSRQQSFVNIVRSPKFVKTVFVYFFADAKKLVRDLADVPTNDVLTYEFKIKSDSLSRYEYYTYYAEPLLKDYEQMKGVFRVYELPREFPAFYLSKRTNQNGKQIIGDMVLNQSTSDGLQRHINGPISRPLVVVVDEDESEILQRETRKFGQKCIILVFCHKEKQTTDMTDKLGDVLVITKENSIEEMDKALEKYVVSLLRSAFNFMHHSGMWWKHSCCYF